jgi:hypothetical protein
VLKGAAVPILFAAGESGIGVDALLEACAALLPAPNESGRFTATDARGEDRPPRRQR